MEGILQLLSPRSLPGFCRVLSVTISEVNNLMGDMDLFLMDLILKGKVRESDRILDAGSGSGRNSFFFLKNGFDLVAIDRSESEVRSANFISRNLIGRDVCSLGDLRRLPYEAASFDLIICSRVLHFSENEQDFKQTLAELKRVLAPKGILYLTMASQIGFDAEINRLPDGKIQFHDGTVRFALTRGLIEEIELDWRHVEQPRTVLFGHEHAETTLVLTSD